MSIVLCNSTSILLTSVVIIFFPTSTLACTPSLIFPFGASVIASFLVVQSPQPLHLLLPWHFQCHLQIQLWLVNLLHHSLLSFECAFKKKLEMPKMKWTH
jgi:hypothetical protein